MKVTGVNTPRTPSVRRSEKAGEARGGDFRKTLRQAADGHAEPPPVGASAPLGAVDSILAAQEVPDATAGRANARARQRAEAMLDELDEIRRALVVGGVPRDRLERLLKLVRVRRELADNPRLAAILDEIELRARVELAKFGRYA
ncbi:MAG: flagellar assembly protein FliX [Proteobacteria bacterium]|nr:flagellar assembly protein FliX [Pseudomonadota bacterium]